MVTFFTFLNTAFVILILCKLYGFRFELHKEQTWLKKNLLHYQIRLIRETSGNNFRTLFRFKIPIRNEPKTRLKEEIETMISEVPESNKRQRLGAKFSWLKTLDEVNQFERNYTIVDRIYVEKLVREWKQKNNFTEL